MSQSYAALGESLKKRLEMKKILKNSISRPCNFLAKCLDRGCMVLYSFIGTQHICTHTYIYDHIVLFNPS